MFKKTALIAFVLFFSSTAMANNFIFSPALSHMSRKSQESGGSIDTKITNVDIRLGYVFGEYNIYAGGVYSLVNAKEGSNSDVSEFYMGPSIGYLYENFHAELTYIIISEQDITGNNAAKYSSGSGFQLDVGYNVQINDYFYLGPMLSYRAVEWSDQQINGIGQANFGGRDMSSLTPYVVLWFQFENS